VSVEGEAAVNRKVHAALAHDLTPIVCVGENLAQNEAGQTHAFVDGQVRAALAGLTGEQARRCIIAYEPLWAIGTGRAATHRPHRPRRHRRGLRGKHRPGRAGPVRRQRQREQHRRLHGHARGGRRPGGRGQPQARLCGAGAAGDGVMLSEYDFSDKKGVRGKYYRAYRQGHTVKIKGANGTVSTQYFTLEDGAVMLEPDVREYFPTSESVNRTLRALIALAPTKPAKQPDTVD